MSVEPRRQESRRSWGPRVWWIEVLWWAKIRRHPQLRSYWCTGVLTGWPILSTGHATHSCSYLTVVQTDIRASESLAVVWTLVVEISKCVYLSLAPRHLASTGIWKLINVAIDKSGAGASVNYKYVWKCLRNKKDVKCTWTTEIYTPIDNPSCSHDFVARLREEQLVLAHSNHDLEWNVEHAAIHERCAITQIWNQHWKHSTCYCCINIVSSAQPWFVLMLLSYLPYETQIQRWLLDYHPAAQSS